MCRIIKYYFPFVIFYFGRFPENCTSTKSLNKLYDILGGSVKNVNISRADYLVHTMTEIVWVV